MEKSAFITESHSTFESNYRDTRGHYTAANSTPQGGLENGRGREGEDGGGCGGSGGQRGLVKCEFRGFDEWVALSRPYPTPFAVIRQAHF